jgi:hypothetical protein
MTRRCEEQIPDYSPRRLSASRGRRLGGRTLALLSSPVCFAGRRSPILVCKIERVLGLLVPMFAPGFKSD